MDIQKHRNSRATEKDTGCNTLFLLPNVSANLVDYVFECSLKSAGCITLRRNGMVFSKVMRSIDDRGMHFSLERVNINSKESPRQEDRYPMRLP